MHALQHPELCSSAPSAEVPGCPPVFRLFFLGTSSDGGAYGRMERWTIVADSAEDGTCVGNDSSVRYGCQRKAKNASHADTHCQASLRLEEFFLGIGSEGMRALAAARLASLHAKSVRVCPLSATGPEVEWSFYTERKSPEHSRARPAAQGSPLGQVFHTSSLTLPTVVSGSKDIVRRRPETRRKVIDTCGVCGMASSVSCAPTSSSRSSPSPPSSTSPVKSLLGVFAPVPPPVKSTRV